MKRLLDWFYGPQKEATQEKKEANVREVDWNLLPEDMCRAGAIWRHLIIPQRLRLRCVSRFWRDADPEAAPPEQWIPETTKMRGFWHRWCIVIVLQYRFHLRFPEMQYVGVQVHSACGEIHTDQWCCLMWQNKDFELHVIDHGHPIDDRQFIWLTRQSKRVLQEDWGGSEAFFAEIFCSVTDGL